MVVIIATLFINCSTELDNKTEMGGLSTPLGLLVLSLSRLLKLKNLESK